VSAREGAPTRPGKIEARKLSGRSGGAKRLQGCPPQERPPGGAELGAG
jgi:hypothetical protein